MEKYKFTRRQFVQTAGILTAAKGLIDIPAYAMASDSQQTSSAPFCWLPLRQVKPAGWIKAQLQMDLREGFAGKLDQLAPAEVATDIFGSGRNRTGRLNKAKPNQPDWWNGEYEGNWRTGYIMMAYLGDVPEAKREADDYVRHILQTQDEDGYIGIYSPQLRYSQDPDNGELWTQACILRGLLAYYELTGNTKVFTAIERAVECTMAHYGPNKQGAFGIAKRGGITHGLMFADVLERLYDLTSKAKYKDFGLWLYQDFSAHIFSSYNVFNCDTRLAFLLDVDRPFFGHGVHTYESIRVPLWLSSVSGKLDFKRAYDNAFQKVKRYTFCSGSAVGMENIGARVPDPTYCFYEYCDIKELLSTFCSVLQKTGNAQFGDRVEQIIFNAAQGARAAQGKAITYLTRDNRYKVSGALGGRDKFSPTHADVAACCVANATQIMALYVRGMWMRERQEQGLAATLYGPCSVDTNVRGANVHIEEETLYPFSPEVSITLLPERPVKFPLLLRNPGWSKNTRVTCDGSRVEREGDYFIVRKTWQKGDRVSVTFNESIIGIPASNGEVAIQRGPLIYALQIPAKEQIIKSYGVPGFADTLYFPAQGAHWDYALKVNPGKSGDDYDFSVQRAQNVNMLYPYEGASPIRLEGDLYNSNSGKLERCTLIPMGLAEASLRRETFPF